MAFRVAIAAAVAALGTVHAIAWNETVVTANGVVQGEAIGNVIYFHSIPFAAPPVGDLRFAPPSPPASWSGTKDVSAMPPLCPQIKLFDLDIFGNEDCLYLHVYVPNHPPDVQLPVMLWLFGGGWMFGDGDEFTLYDGTNMAIAQNVIVVSPNYRVGVFGFLALNELMSESGTTGNNGLLDQTMAMQWVHDNIAAFGGDPTHVTIFGESAGGFSVAWHLVSKASAGLFQAAIMESGSVDSPQFFQTLDYATTFGIEYSAGCGCTQSGAALLTCLRTLSTTDLMNCNINATTPLAEALPKLKAALPAGFPNLDPALWPFMPFGAAIDGVSLAGTPLQLIQAGAYNRVPWVLGTNQNEGSIFVPAIILVCPGTGFPPSTQDLEAALTQMLNMYPPANVAAVIPSIMNAYPAESYADGWARGSAMITHYMFTCSARRGARAVLADPQALPVWMYQFTLPLDFVGGVLYDVLGDWHSSELTFVWGNPFIWALDWSANDATISAAFQRYWTNLGRFHSPNDPTVPLFWPRYTTNNYTNLDITLPIGVATNLEDDLCNFWDQAVAQLGKPTGA